MKYLKKESNGASDVADEKYSLRNALANVYLLMMLAVFPLFVNTRMDGVFPFIHMDKGYFSIRHDKYYFFLIMTGLAVVAVLLLLLTYSQNSKSAKGIDTRPFYKKTSFTDWAAIALLISSTVSALISEYKEEAFLGTPYGRNNGLVLIIFYVAAYFLITRCFVYREYVFVAMSIGCGLMYLLAVLNGFYIDPLGMFSMFRSEFNMVTFISTIGNKNMLSSAICVTLPAIALFSVHTEKLSFRIVHLVSAFFGFMAVIITDSDSVLLGIGAFFAIFLAVYVRRIDRLKRFFLVLTVMLLGAPSLRLFSAIMGNNYKPLGQFSTMLIFSNIILLAILVLALITAGLYLLDKKKPEIVLPAFVPIIILVLTALGVLSGLGVMVYYSVFDTKTDLGSMTRLVRFNDGWGTHRGIMWIRAMRIFDGAPIVNKIFGFGPDTFYEKFTPYFAELKKYSDGSTNAAHNEYINYLITIGIAGLASYIAMVGGALFRAFKAAKNNPVVLAFAAAVVSYSAQAVVNISTPITTPIFFVFVALCEAVARKYDTHKPAIK